MPFSSFIRSIAIGTPTNEERSTYPFRIPSLQNLGELELHPKVTFFVGENGSGKSTLIEAIAVSVGLNPEGGSRNFRFATKDSHSSLHSYLKLARGTRRPKDSFFLRAESFFNVATQVDELGVGSAYGGQSLHEQSHGESFLSLFLNRFRGNSLYLMDEPEAALSPMRQMSMVAIIHRLVRQDSQLIIATHSPIIMSYPEATIYSFGTSGITKIDYEQTEHYKVTSDFIKRRERMLQQLMADE